MTYPIRQRQGLVLGQVHAGWTGVVKRAIKMTWGRGQHPNPCDNLHGGEAWSRASPLSPQTRLTVLLVEGVVAQAQGGPAAPALEAAAVEEASLGTGSLQDVDAAAAEVAGVAALPPGRWLRRKRTGWGLTTEGLTATLPGGFGQGFRVGGGGGPSCRGGSGCSGLLAPVREWQVLALENQLGQETGREEPGACGCSLAQPQSQPLAQPHQPPVPPKLPLAQNWTPSLRGDMRTHLPRIRRCGLWHLVVPIRSVPIQPCVQL